jgi:hypothetical protein
VADEILFSIRYFPKGLDNGWILFEPANARDSLSKLRLSSRLIAAFSVMLSDGYSTDGKRAGFYLGACIYDNHPR